jgi:site-specific recombinase
MQALHFTLATKQPSMTASALAGKLQRFKEGHDEHEIIDEIVRITRSQFAAALGNIGCVIPGSIGFYLLFSKVFGTVFLDDAYAHKIVASLDPIRSLTIPMAACTGIVLWISSVSSGWVENWVVFRRVPEALALNRRLNLILGADRCMRLSQWFLRNIAQITGNVTLGSLLAFGPIFGRFFGLPIDLRHVTLSSGALTFAMCFLGFNEHTMWPFIFAAIGIVCIGLLNFGVSFMMAFAVAARARNVEAENIQRIVRAVGQRFRRHPGDFFFPRQRN